MYKLHCFCNITHTCMNIYTLCKYSIWVWVLTIQNEHRGNRGNGAGCLLHMFTHYACARGHNVYTGPPAVFFPPATFLPRSHLSTYNCRFYCNLLLSTNFNWECPLSVSNNNSSPEKLALNFVFSQRHEGSLQLLTTMSIWPNAQ